MHCGLCHRVLHGSRDAAVPDHPWVLLGTERPAPCTFYHFLPAGGALPAYGRRSHAARVRIQNRTGVRIGAATERRQHPNLSLMYCQQEANKQLPYSSPQIIPQSPATLHYSSSPQQLRYCKQKCVNPWERQKRWVYFPFTDQTTTLSLREGRYTHAQGTGFREAESKRFLVWVKG
jgi:hypothetical protein